MTGFFSGTLLQLPTDTVNYYSPAAVNLLEGKGYTVSGDFLKRYPPGFPFLLAGIYKITGHADTSNPYYPWAAALLQAFSCGFIYLISRLYFSSRISVMSAVLFAGYPFFMALSVTRYCWNAMPFFLFLFFQSVFFYLKAGQGKEAFLPVSAFLLGAASLVWPGVAFIWIPMAVLCFRFKVNLLKKIILTGLFTAAFWTLPFLWHEYTAKTAGEGVWFSNNQVLMNGTIRHETSKIRQFEVSQDAARFQQAGHLKKPADFLNFYREEFQNKPIKTLKFLSFKALRPWYATDSELHETGIAWIQAPYLILGVLGAGICFFRQRYFLLLSAGAVFYFWLVSFSVLSILRYMMPAMGFVMIWTAVSIEAIAGGIRGIKNEKI